MRMHTVMLLSTLLGYASAAHSAAVRPDPEAGRLFVERSCSSCHAMTAATTASDAAPPLSALAKANKERPAWIRGWLMAPHPPMPSISLSRQQIDNVIAYLSTLSTE